MCTQMLSIGQCCDIFVLQRLVISLCRVLGQLKMKMILEEMVLEELVEEMVLEELEEPAVPAAVPAATQLEVLVEEMVVEDMVLQEL